MPWPIASLGVRHFLDLKLGRTMRRIARALGRTLLRSPRKGKAYACTGTTVPSGFASQQSTASTYLSMSQTCALKQIFKRYWRLQRSTILRFPSRPQATPTLAHLLRPIP